jgi:dienelactone hydrolase
MRTEHLSTLTLIVGLLSNVGCGNSAPDGGGGGTSARGGAQNGAGGSMSAGASAGAPGAAGSTSGSAGSLASAGSLGSAGAVGSAGSIGSGGVSGSGGGSGSASAIAGSAHGGNATGGASAGSTGTAAKGGGGNSGTCTASKAASANVSGSGPHKVTVETNSDTGIKEGTIFRPTDLGGTEKYPIFVWGEGGCSLNGLSNSAAMGEIASHGYFVVADGTPNNNGSRNMDSSNPTAMGAPLLAYISWAIAENEKPCSAYYHSLDTTKIAANGFSCGGLMAEGTAGDPRMTTWGLTSSGLFSANPAFYKTVHTPVLMVLGGPSDIAYENGERDYDNISALGIPILLFSKDIGHGGDLSAKNGGDFTKLGLAWLNWQLKGDQTATGKGLLVGSACSYCTNSAWEVKSKNIP